MRKNIFKVLCLAVSFCMLIGMMAACQTASPAATSAPAASQAEAVASASSSAAPSAAASTVPSAPVASTDPITFTAICEPQLVQCKWGDDEVSKYITQHTGVTLDITYQTTYDDQALSTLLASGSTLPDFIVDGYGSPVDDALYQQGFVQPLNKLADQYSPDFWKWLPKDMDKIYGAPDGNLYGVGDMYGDMSRRSDLKVSSYVDTGIAIQKGLMDKIGNPPLDTLAEFKDACVKIKQTFPNMKNIIMDEAATNPTSYRSLTQIINKIYGGQNVISIAADGTVHMNFKDEAYLNALKYVGDLYRSGLIPKESFTMTGEQTKQALLNNDVFAYFGFYYNLGAMEGNFTSNTPYWSIEPPTAPNVPRDQIKLDDQYCGIGGWHCTHISKDCKNSARAIQYITFLLSDDGQNLQRLGVKDSSYTVDASGNYSFTAKRIQLSQTSPDKTGSQLGFDNWNWDWLEEFHVIMVGEGINATALPALGDFYNMYGKYAADERINLLTANIKDKDMQVLRAKIDDLWKNEYAKIVLAPSEDALVAEYNTFLSQANALGLAKLEQAYTDNYKAEKAKLG